MTDVLIIGSGPAGMSAAIYAKRANLNVLIVEKEYEGTGQMAESSRIDNYPGFYGINGYELGEKIREHAEALGIKFSMSGSRSVDHCFAALYFTAFQCDIKAFFRFLNTGHFGFQKFDSKCFSMFPDLFP